MKLSQLLRTENLNERNAFLLGMIYAWPIFSEDEKYVLAYSSYKIDGSPKMKNCLNGDQKFYTNKHIGKLKKFIGDAYTVLNNTDVNARDINFDHKIGSGVSVLIENDIDKKNIYGVIEKWLIDIDDKYKEYFLSGFMDSRGSLDFTGSYYTIDITQKDFPELAKRKLNRLNDILGMVYNYNPRLLQEKSFSKNDQFRVNLDYFAGHYGFFRPHIIDYYESQRATMLKAGENGFYYDERFVDKELPITASNFEINQLAISLKGLSREEKDKRILEYKMEKFDFDTEDEILYSSYNTKERAKANAGYICEFQSDHDTFTSKSTSKYYVEAHHLIPFAERKNFDVSIDIVENIVCLCPNCHRKIHLAVDKEKKGLLNPLFEKKENFLKQAGINIALEDLYAVYGVGK